MHHKVCSVRGSHFFRILRQNWQVTASTYREDPFAVAALEACLVVGDAVGREEVDEMDGLLAGRALVLRAGERHGCRRLWLWLHALARRWMESQSLLSSARVAGK